MKNIKVNLFNNIYGINFIPIFTWNVSISFLFLLFYKVEPIGDFIYMVNILFSGLITPIILSALNIRYVNKSKKKTFFINIILMLISIIIGNYFNFFIVLHFEYLMVEGKKDFIFPRGDQIFNVLLIIIIGIIVQIILVINSLEKKQKNIEKMEEDWWWK